MHAHDYTQDESAARLPGSLPPPLPAELELTEPARATELLTRARPHVRAYGRAVIVLLLTLAVLLGDGGAVGASFAAAVVATLVWALSFESASVGARLKRSAVGPATSTLAGTAVGLVSLSGISLWIHGLGLSVARLAILAVLVLAGVTAWEWFLERLLPVQRRILVVGAGSGGTELIDAIAIEAWADYEIAGIVDDDRQTDQIAGVPFMGRVDDLPDVVRRARPDLVVVAVERNRQEVFDRLLQVAESGFSVVGLPEFYEQSFGRLPVRHLTPAWFMSVLHLYQRPYPRFMKRAFDLTIASLALIATAPLFPLIALLVRRTGPVVFRQVRLGECGREFTIYKFRTMWEDAESSGEALWAEERDPRATRLGRLLRRTRLDELPQLVNVLRGEMSIVGPRPERPEYLAELSDAVPFWTTRHLLKPGITGWAQVSASYAADLATTERKLSYDLWYLRHRSLTIDVLVCLKTLKRLVSGSGAR